MAAPPMLPLRTPSFPASHHFAAIRRLRTSWTPPPIVSPLTCPMIASVYVDDRCCDESTLPVADSILTSCFRCCSGAYPMGTDAFPGVISCHTALHGAFQLVR